MSSEHGGRPPEEFALAAAEGGITRWNIRSCSICGVPLNFLFAPDGTVTFQSGCACLWSDPSPRSWDDVAAHYNMQRAEHVIARYDEFWGFASRAQGGTS